MASLFGVLCTFMMVFLATTDTSVEGAREFRVGDHLGWHEPDSNNTAFYTQWAARNRFQVGDSLVFEYQNDSVLVVEKWDYFHCDSSDPIIAFDNGNSTLTLERSGFFYFVSGDDDHCQNGQKLIVEVMSPHPIYSSPPSISIPPEGSSAMAPSLSSHGLRLSASMVLGSVFMALLATFVIVFLSAP
ncbi:early nodulin-like protein 7 [Gastrolobium bilobum]|uniref:early nodulin-like protein 7 n=1 Tax=Gastrolobium bilobum TaxID=150636 RepID=UPI002AB00F99|nr:early nodulin-like protein 7 [Gastrolobium bilobum]